MSDKTIRLLYDRELRRPGCVLLQAVAGGDRGALLRLFGTEDWLDAPTPGMRIIEGTEEQWKREVKR